jgi:hypothetical protein
VRVDGEAACEFIKSIVESDAVVKIGFGLKSDRAVLLSKLGARIRAMVDLADALRRKGIRQTLGAKAAVAMVLGQRLQKSRSVTTSNWARQTLLPKQLLYAANDAYAALAVFYALDLHQPPVPAAENFRVCRGRHACRVSSAACGTHGAPWHHSAWYWLAFLPLNGA